MFAVGIVQYDIYYDNVIIVMLCRRRGLGTINVHLGYADKEICISIRARASVCIITK